MSYGELASALRDESVNCIAPVADAFRRLADRLDTKTVAPPVAEAVADEEPRTDTDVIAPVDSDELESFDDEGN